MKINKRAEHNGVELHIVQVSSANYVQIRRGRDQHICFYFSRAPYKGSLRELYARFAEAVEKIDAKAFNRMRSPKDYKAAERNRAIMAPLIALLDRRDDTSYVLRAA